jgi:SAM-dependent methyltransferase
MTYGEMLGRNNRLPHAGVVLENDIPSAAWGLVIPVLHHSLDAGMKPEQHNLETAGTQLAEDLALGEHAVLMNHPDIHVDELETLLRSLDLSDTWCATMSETAAWIRTSHCLPTVSRTGVHEYMIDFPEPLSNATTIRVTRESLTTTSEIPRCTLQAHVAPDKNCLIEEIQVNLEDYFKDISKVLMSHHLEKGRPREGIHGSIITNCDRLGSRANSIIKMIPIEPDDTVAELGCGYGFLAIGLHKASGAKINGFDAFEAYLDLGKDFLDRNPELHEKVTLGRHDYLAEPLPEATYDVVLLNNTLLYILGRGNQIKAMRNVYRSLKPGGRVFTFQANRWFPLEPFTKMPIVHWVPRRLGTLLTQRVGKRTMMDLHHISPMWMRTMLQRIGCKDIKYWPESTPADSCSLLKRLFCRFYGMTAVKPIGNEGG